MALAASCAIAYGGVATARLPAASVTMSHRAVSSSRVAIPGCVVTVFVVSVPASGATTVVGSTTTVVGGGAVVGGGVGGGGGRPVPAVLTVSVADIEDMAYPSAGSLVTTSKSYEVFDSSPVMSMDVALVEPPIGIPSVAPLTRYLTTYVNGGVPVVGWDHDRVSEFAVMFVAAKLK